MREYWQSGDSVVLRNTGFFTGDAWCTPHVVVSDAADLVALYRPEGTRFQVLYLEEGTFVEPERTRMDVLRLMLPGLWYGVELFFDTGRGAPSYRHFGGAGRFRGWKVNIEAPFQRTRIGFDTTDHFVDIVVRPDRSWFWKDEQMIDEWLAKSAYRPDEAEMLLETGRQVARAIARAAFPFDSTWTDWIPPDVTEGPVVPDGWHLLPGVGTTLGLGRPWNSWKMRDTGAHPPL